MVRYLLTNGAPVINDRMGRNPLVTAIIQEGEGGIVSLVEGGGGGGGGLHPSSSVLELLIQGKSDIEMFDIFHNTSPTLPPPPPPTTTTATTNRFIFRNNPLLCACKYGNTYAVKLLLQHKARIDYHHPRYTPHFSFSSLFANAAGATPHLPPPLIVCTMHNRPFCFRLLVEAGADLDAIFGGGYYTMKNVVPSYNPTDIWAQLLEYQKNIVSIANSIKEGDDAKDIASKLRWQESERILPASLSSSFLVGSIKQYLVKSSNPKSLLMCAATFGRSKIISELLHAKSNVNAKTRNGEDALYLAARNGKYCCAHKLIEAKASISSSISSSSIQAASSISSIIQAASSSSSIIQAAAAPAPTTETAQCDGGGDGAGDATPVIKQLERMTTSS
eukprot:jgi/Bigna1/141179/aug1.61_g15887